MLAQCNSKSIQHRFWHSAAHSKTLSCFGFTLEQLKKMEPVDVEILFYPPKNLQCKNVPLPDFQQYYDRIHAKGSKVNVTFCWLEYKQDNPAGYEQSQFYELYNRFVERNFGKRDVKMAVERIPGENALDDDYNVSAE